MRLSKEKIDLNIEINKKVKVDEQTFFTSGVWVSHARTTPICLFRWYKFTLKPPYSIVHDNLRLAIWDTSFWTFWVKFGHKGP